MTLLQEAKYIMAPIQYAKNSHDHVRFHVNLPLLVYNDRFLTGQLEERRFFYNYNINGTLWINIDYIQKMVFCISEENQ